MLGPDRAHFPHHHLDPTQPLEWEGEALDPDVLQRLVLDVIDQHTDRTGPPGAAGAQSLRSTSVVAFVGGVRKSIRRGS